MKDRLAVLFAALGVALAGLAPSEFMLCFHRDGKVLVEHYQELCCKVPCAGEEGCAGDDGEGAASRSDCPDDECQDLPLNSTLDAALRAASTPTVALILGPAPLPVAFEVEVLPPAPAPFESPGPPLARPETLLRSVVLRL
jgi:hypothetical protein